MIDLDNLEALAKAATPGPWCQGMEHFKHGIRLDEHDDKSVEDARFIAAANPATILELINELRGYRKTFRGAACSECRCIVIAIKDDEKHRWMQENGLADKDKSK